MIRLVSQSHDIPCSVISSPSLPLPSAATDDAAFLDRTPSEAERGGDCADPAPAAEAVPPVTPPLALAPSLTPAPQPTISLLSDDNADALSVESLTLLPPTDPTRLRSFSTQSSREEELPRAGPAEDTPTPTPTPPLSESDSQEQQSEE